MKRSILQLSIIFILLSTIVFSVMQAQQPVFRIGVLDTETGAIYRGAQLAVDELNAAGGVQGADGTTFQLQLVLHPPDDMVQAVNSIRQASVIAVMGPETTQQVLNNLSMLQSLGVPILTPAIGDTLIISDASQMLFRLRAQEILHGRALANYLFNDLGTTRIVTAQLDLESTASVIGFSTSLSAFGIAPQAALLLDSSTTIEQLAQTSAQLNPQVLALYGTPESARVFYQALRSQGWNGLLVYNQASDPVFLDGFSNDALTGILAISTWNYTVEDARSDQFLLHYSRAFGELPDGIAAASYDGIYLLAEAINKPGDLRTNLSNLSNIVGTQGMLATDQLSRGELSNNAIVSQMGGYGAPQVVARYAGNERIETVEDVVTGIEPTDVPATPTPEGVVITIKSAVQNVRTGPSTQYDILGQLKRDEQAKVIGATVDFSWVVIEYRGQNGWLFADLLTIFGDTAKIPVFSPPPTPTPPPATATPTSSPVADIIVVGATPSNFTVGVPFNIIVTIKNQGSLNAGPFAVAATFNPGNIYSGVNLPGLAAGQQTNITLSGTFPSSSAPQTVTIVADLNNEVNEGTAGENNNSSFQFTYVVDRPVLNAGTLTLNPGNGFSLEGSGSVDLMWNGAGTALDTQNGAGVYLIPGVASWNNISYDLIDLSLATTPSLNVALLNNAYIGIKTAEGNRGIVHVDQVAAGGQIIVTYRVYQP